ncbi:hypothetical protein PMIN06_008300 [Paraphaeosphaeria minitans]
MRNLVDHLSFKLNNFAELLRCASSTYRTQRGPSSVTGQQKPVYIQSMPPNKTQTIHTCTPDGSSIAVEAAIGEKKTRRSVRSTYLPGTVRDGGARMAEYPRQRSLPRQSWTSMPRALGTKDVLAVTYLPTVDATPPTRRAWRTKDPENPVHVFLT